MWCLPVFIVLFAGLGLWGFWRWLKIKQANQYLRENPVNDVQATNPDDQCIDGLMKSRSSCLIVIRKMKMITNAIDPHHFNQKTQRIRAQVSRY